MELALGQVIRAADKYRVLRVLGQGAMGAVYEAENVRIHRRVAIKALHAGLVGKRDTLMRFELEAQAAGRIGSRHITEVLDTGELADGTRFMVMEFLEGMTLHERIRSRGRLAPNEIAPIVVDLLEGLAAAHHAGIVHRDLKPANVFLVTSRGGDEVKILDFGVSKFNVLDGGDGMNMTSTGMILGTPFYMSPEQAKGSRAIDGRSDLYSVGVILYEAITGQVPFSAETFNELIFRIVLESPPPPEQFVPDLDGAFAVILRKAMARDADQRFQTAEEFRGALRAWIEMQGGANVGVAQGGTMLMAGARGGTLMLDGAPTTPFASALAPPVNLPPPGTMPLVGSTMALRPTAGSEPSPARLKARAASGAIVAVVVMTVACVTMAGIAAVLLARGRHPTAAGDPAPTAEAPRAVASGATPIPAETKAAPASTPVPAPPPTGVRVDVDALPEASSDAPAPPTSDARAAGPAAPAPRARSAPRDAKPAEPAHAAAPSPAPAPAPTKRTISGDL